MERVGDVLNKTKNIYLDTKDSIVQGGFTQVPNHILKSKSLTVREKITYAMFLSYAWNNDYVFPGQEKLANDIGVGTRSITTFIKGLEKKGLITIKRRGLGKTNICHIHFRVKK